ncbi:MAG: molybdenum cofactor guanylyltransferase [Dokdonella sp.]
MSDASVTVAILAGGQGRRLGGVDKGLQIVSGKPLIAHVCVAVEAMHAPKNAHGDRDVLILANRNLQRYSTYARTLPDDIDSGKGPLAGIATTLSAMSTPWLLTVPVDCPYPPLDLWRRLQSAIGDADCAVSHDGMHRQPLFALYRLGLAPSAKKAAKAGLGPQAWQDQIDTVDIDFDDQRENFANLNSAADFDAYGNVADE